MIYLGLYSEMRLYADNGKLKDNICEEIDYDKKKVVDYLNAQEKIAVCPRVAIDCLTGEQIATSFSVYTDGEYEWCDFLAYHIQKYNVKLPEEFINKVGAENSKVR
ncbi:MAG: hypothetical protein LUH08_00320 [Ruminococcus sp.]|nr:hypothetical protein [Ruminococcus sp.]